MEKQRPGSEGKVLGYTTRHAEHRSLFSAVVEAQILTANKVCVKELNLSCHDRVIYIYTYVYIHTHTKSQVFLNSGKLD